MAKAATRALTYTQGDGFTHVVKLRMRDGDDLVPRPIPPGATYEAQVREYEGSETAWAFSIDVDEPTSELTLTLDPDQTAEQPENCVWDIQEIVATVPTTFLRGAVTVAREVTRDA